MASFPDADWYQHKTLLPAHNADLQPGLLINIHHAARCVATGAWRCSFNFQLLNLLPAFVLTF